VLGTHASRVILGCLVLSSLTHAQRVIVVDPNGGGDYTQLQQAIDAVSSGTRIRVIGGTYGPITIAKSLTILGDPAPTIMPPQTGSSAQPPAIDLTGTGSETLTLHNVTVTGQTPWPFGQAGAGIRSSGFREIRILHSSIHAPNWSKYLTGAFFGASAVDAVGATRVIVVSSDVRGSHSDTDGSGGPGQPDGPPGIRAPGATVLVLTSTVTGGNGSDLFFTWGCTDPCPCKLPTNFAGLGGVGIAAATVFESGSQVAPGTSGSAWCRPDQTSPYKPWGQQPPSSPYAVTTLVEIPADVVQWGSLRIGGLWALSFAPLTSGGALFLAPLAATPTAFGSSWLFLDIGGPFLFVQPLPAMSFGFALAIANDPALIGFSPAVQIYGFATNRLSRPAFDVVGFR